MILNSKRLLLILPEKKLSKYFIRSGVKVDIFNKEDLLSVIITLLSLEFKILTDIRFVVLF